MKKLFTLENFLQLVRELLWLTITAAIALAILYPITSKIDYIYLKPTFGFIMLTLTYFRWSMLIKSIPFLRPALVRFLLFTANLSLTIYIVNVMQKVMGLMENMYTEDIGFPKVILFEADRAALFSYVYNVVVLFGTGAVIMIVAFNLRLIISWWQFYKYKANALMGD